MSSSKSKFRTIRLDHIMSISERAMALWIELQIRMGMFSLKFCAPRKYSTIECYTKPSWPFVQFEDWKSAIGQRRILYIRTLTLLLGFIVLILILPLSYVFSSLNQKAHIDYGFTKEYVTIGRGLYPTDSK